MKPPAGLTWAARAAYTVAERELGDDAQRFRTVLLGYTYAVDLETRARAEWEREKRPLIQVHGAAGVHPLVKVMLDRVALPGPVWRDGERPRLALGGPGPLMNSDVAVVNQARGHALPSRRLGRRDLPGR